MDEELLDDYIEMGRRLAKTGLLSKELTSIVKGMEEAFKEVTDDYNKLRLENEALKRENERLRNQALPEFLYGYD